MVFSASSADVPETIGFWGLVTSSQDWCEENYTYTHYIAEFWNTLSNAFILFYGLFGMITVVRAKMEKRFLYSYLSLAIVGLGSCIFHCTLQWSAQLLDEIPMIFTAVAMNYALFIADVTSKKEIMLYRFIFISYPFIVIPYYIYTGDFEMFFLAYGAMVVSMLVKSARLMKGINKMVPKERLVYPNDPKKLVLKAVAFYGLGFLLWNVDNELCGPLKDFRMQFPEIIRPFLELHSWWHFGSGYGTYLLIFYSQVVSQYNKEFNPKFQNQQVLQNIKNQGVCYFKTVLPYSKDISMIKIK